MYFILSVFCIFPYVLKDLINLIVVTTIPELLLSGCYHRKCLPWWPFVLSVVNAENLVRTDACPSWKGQMAL